MRVLLKNSFAIWMKTPKYVQGRKELFIDRSGNILHVDPGNLV